VRATVFVPFSFSSRRLSDAEFQASEACLVDFITSRGNTNAWQLLTYRKAIECPLPPSHVVDVV
jgi:hypothetical protein